ncbi:Molybdopterin biosynthesis protein MoeB [Pectobacterium sp. F1-1]|uniref:ThiF family adenylyltransferase n=1 Tax=Pectobacterium sp. F1-1 TaxID=2949614 RepID=UPI0021D7CDC3|nr:ThiF family adenylyltransferase [Pectobacterium sp. F1-1]UYA62168.1 Molybdopterin biosynthesis protein MoeB [Pectobacterium sp. F1-1]
MNKYVLGKYVIAQELRDGNYLGLGSKQVKIKSEEQWKCIISLAAKAIEPIELSELEKIDIVSEIPGTLQYLIENNFIVESCEVSMTSRYSRTYYYYQSLGLNVEQAEKNMRNSTVTVLGCGGIGNHISAALVSNGVGHVNLVDGDYIELSNLTRQILFDEHNVGCRKVEILAKRLKERNSECNINSIDLYIKDENDLDKLPKSDLIILSADSEDIVTVVNKYCIKNKVPYINVCYMNDIAVWGPFVIPGKTGCHACGCERLSLSAKSSGDNSAILKCINNRFKSATFPPVNATASALATADIIRYLAGSEAISTINRRIGLHDYTLKVEEQDFSINKNCKVCQNL